MNMERIQPKGQTQADKEALEKRLNFKPAPRTAEEEAFLNRPLTPEQKVKKEAEDKEAARLADRKRLLLEKISTRNSIVIANREGHGGQGDNVTDINLGKLNQEIKQEREYLATYGIEVDDTI